MTTIDLTIRQAEILGHLHAAGEAITAYVRPGGNTDVANLHYYGPAPEHLRIDGTTYSRVLYPLRDAGLLTIAEERTTRGRQVKITEHGQLVLTSLNQSAGLAGIEARLQLAPTRAAVDRYMELAVDARRMARALHALERELDYAERRGESTVSISRIRYDLRELTR